MGDLRRAISGAHGILRVLDITKFRPLPAGLIGGKRYHPGFFCENQPHTSSGDVGSASKT
jgi:hypothetical protein